jgi:Thioredoxin
MNGPLDAWTDAAQIARRLAQANAELLVALGAEAWCAKCRALRPEFESHCQTKAPASVVWLWLDLEDHAEFIGDFIPDDLPLLLRYRAGQIVQAAVIEDMGTDTLKLRDVPKPELKPSLWDAFSAKNWANG